MNLKRINLCFDIDDPRQKRAYNVLQSAGRKKTATIVNMIFKLTIPTFEEYEESCKDKNVNDLPECFNRESTSSEASSRIDEIYTGIAQILKTLHMMQNGSTIPQAGAFDEIKDPQPRNEGAESPSDEMSEDAFSAMMSLFN